MDAIIEKGPLSGEVHALSSKSFGHRALICGALSKGETQIFCNSFSEDILATVNCVRALGCNIEETTYGFLVKEMVLNEKAELFPKESGSTFRFLLSIVGALGVEATFHGEGRLFERPLSPLKERLIEHGMEIWQSEPNVIKTKGTLKAGAHEIAGDVSSQFITGLLFALPLLKEDSTLKVLGRLESFYYVNITLEVLKDFGIEIKREGNIFYIKGSQEYKSKGQYVIEGDWSNSAVWLCAGAMIKDGITVKGLNLRSSQGDKRVINILRDMGAMVMADEEDVIVRAGNLLAIDINALDFLDIVPVLAVVMCFAQGKSRIYGVGRLKYKESDRLLSTCKLINDLGGRAETYSDCL